MRRFQIGDTVTYDPGMRRTVPPGAYKIIAWLPEEDTESEYRYRIRSLDEVTERVAKESQLTFYDLP